jgi:hypothetical protein
VVLQTREHFVACGSIASQSSVSSTPLLSGPEDEPEKWKIDEDEK